LGLFIYLLVEAYQSNGVAFSSFERLGLLKGDGQSAVQSLEDFFTAFASDYKNASRKLYEGLKGMNDLVCIVDEYHTGITPVKVAAITPEHLINADASLIFNAHALPLAKTASIAMKLTYAFDRAEAAANKKAGEATSVSTHPYLNASA
jgi:hypothetical protein